MSLPTETTIEKNTELQYTTEDTVLTSDHDAVSLNKLTRVVVIAIDQSNFSHYAFDWAVKNFLRRETDLVKKTL